MRSAVILLTTALLAGCSRAPSGPDPMDLRSIATQVMAEHLAAKYTGGRALVLGNPFTQRKGSSEGVRAAEDAGQRGLRRGFGDRIAVNVAFPDLKPAAAANPMSVQIPPGTTTPLSYMVAEGAFDRLIQGNPGCDILVSLVGLPARLDQEAFWRQPGKLKIALLFPDFRMLGGADAVKQAFESGRIVSAVMQKPGPPPVAAAGVDYKAIFDEHCVLVTSENVRDVIAKWPQLF